jgi:hypothetical protein
MGEGSEKQQLFAMFFPDLLLLKQSVLFLQQLVFVSSLSLIGSVLSGSGQIFSTVVLATVSGQSIVVCATSVRFLMALRLKTARFSLYQFMQTIM